MSNSSSPSTIDAFMYAYISLAAYPSLAQPTLFSYLTFQFPNLISFGVRMQSLAFLRPLVPSPTFRPTLSVLMQDILFNPAPYLEFAFMGFQQKIQAPVDAKMKEKRVEGFWKVVSVVGAVGFFISYIFSNGIVKVVVVDKEDDENID